MALEDFAGVLRSLKIGAADVGSPLADVQRVIDQVKSAAAAASVPVADMAAKIEQLGQKAQAAKAVKEAAAALDAINGAAAKAPAPLKQTASGMENVGERAAGMASSSTHASGAIGKLQSILESLGPKGQAAAIVIGVLTVGVTALAAAIVGAMSAAISFAAAKNALMGTFTALTGSASGGAATLAIVEKLGRSLPFTTAQIGDWAKELMKTGLQGQQLEAALKAVAGAQALMGESGAAAAKTLISTLARGGFEAAALVMKLKAGLPEARAQLAEMGLGVGDLAQALGLTEQQFRRTRLTAKQMAEAVEKALARKAAGPLADLLLTFPVIVGKVKEGFMSLFGKLGPSVKTFMTVVEKLFSNFYKGGSVIKALEPIVTAVLGKLFEWATKGVKAIQGLATWLASSGKAGGVFSGVVAALTFGWKALVLIFQTVVRALTPVVQALKAIFSNALVLSGIKTIFTVIIAVIVAVVVVVATLAAAIATVAGAIVGFVGAFVGVVSGITGVIGEIVSGAIDALMGLPGGASDAASNFIAGLVSGIAAGAGAVMSAVSGLAQGMLGAFTRPLGIKSPSTVMLKHGEENIAGAAATGINKGSGKVQKSLKGLGPEKGAKGSGEGGEGGGGPNFHFHDCNFGGDLTESRLEAMLRRAYEKMAAEVGAKPSTA